MSAYNHAIKDFEKGRPFIEQIKADKLNAILRELESVRITQVIGGTFKKLPGGTQIVISGNQKTAATASTTQPWDLIAATDPDNENQYKVTVTPGTLNGILPSNWDEEFECAGTGLYYAKAVLTTDGEAITGLSIAIDTNAPTQQAPTEFALPTTVQYLFGLFSEGKVYRAIGNGHIELLPSVWLIKDKTPPAAPGELPYSVFYVLQ